MELDFFSALAACTAIVGIGIYAIEVLIWLHRAGGEETSDSNADVSDTTFRTEEGLAHVNTRRRVTITERNARDAAKQNRKPF